MNTETVRREPSPKQRAVLNFIVEFRDGTGFHPTYREIMEHFGWSSTNAVADHFRALEKKGHIECRRQRYRVLP